LGPEAASRPALPPFAAFPIDPGGWRSRCAPRAGQVQEKATSPRKRPPKIAYNERGRGGPTPDTSPNRCYSVITRSSARAHTDGLRVNSGSARRLTWQQLRSPQKNRAPGVDTNRGTPAGGWRESCPARRRAVTVGHFAAASARNRMISRRNFASVLRGCGSPSAVSSFTA